MSNKKTRAFRAMALAAMLLLAALPARSQSYPYYGQPYGSSTPRIDSVTFPSLSGYVQPGQTVLVRMMGTPGGLARLDVPRVQTGIPMTEVAPGRYEGNFMLGSNANLYNQGTLRVRSRLSLNGQQATYSASLPISTAFGPAPYGGYPQAGNYPAGQIFVNVTGPTSGMVVGRDFTVTGQTLPFAQVQVQAQARQSIIPGLINIGTGRENATGQADANGNFAIPIHLSQGGLLGNGNDIDLKVIATDPRTSASRQVELNIATSP